MSTDLPQTTSQSFSVEGIDQRLLFGQNDIFLRLIESSFDTKIVARGEKVTVEGASSEVHQVIQLLNDLVTRLRRGDFITEQYLNYAITMIKEDGHGPASALPTEALLTSALRKAIKPKTLGQTKYVEAVEKNDIVFSMPGFHSSGG
jgi:phosphate starvation-inducible PhoH-like protein